MIHPLVIPVLVTTDLPPQTDLAAFGRVVADAVALLVPPPVAQLVPPPVAQLVPPTGGPYPGHLHGRTFWLDRPAPPGAPAPAAEQLRFAALLGFLSVALEAPQVTAKAVLADVRTAITEAVAAAYGDLGSAPAVRAIRAQDVRDRTPETALTVATANTASHLARAARAQLVG
jgi:hypothetical protein